MKRLALPLPRFTTLAHADSIPVYDPTGDVYNLPTDRGRLLLTPASSALTHVPNNNVLKAVAVGATSIVQRDGFYTPGDGGKATYIWSNTPCPLPDNGAQVAPNVGTGCWLISKETPLLPEIWGAYGNDINDDNAALAAACLLGR